MFLLDTNVVSEIRKPRPNAGVASWLESVGRANHFISVLTVGEIRRGVELLRPRNADHADDLEQWLVRLQEQFDDRILPVTAAIAQTWGRLTIVRTVSSVDALLAATAREHGLTLVTRNVRDIADLGVRVLDPFV